MRSAHTVEQVRQAEAALMARLPDGMLMQRAAAGLAHAVLDLLGHGYGARVLLLVGAGNNGGDALFAGALLAGRGVQVHALLLDPGRAHTEGLAALRRAGGRVVDAVEQAPRPDVVVDGIVGIGGSGGLRPDAARAVVAVAGVPVLAVDTPSGVEVDTGQVDGPHVRADVTVTFGTHKVAHLVDPAAMACGAVHLVDLGLDLPAPAVTALQESDVRRLLPRPAPDAHKYTRGVVGVRAGSEQYPGAGVLCVSGAGTGLVGMVRYLGGAADLVRDRHPEVVVGEGRVQAWVIGSGGGADAGQALADALADGGARRRGRGRPHPRHRAARRARAAHPARRRAGPDARRRACAGRGRPAPLRAGGRRAVRRGGAAEGPAHAGRRPRRRGPGHHRRAGLAGDRRRR